MARRVNGIYFADAPQYSEKELKEWWERVKDLSYNPFEWGLDFSDFIWYNYTRRAARERD